MRLFVALDFPDAVRQRLRQLIARLQAYSSGARWVKSEGMHVTLKFIGYVDAGKVGAICSALAPIYSAQAVDMHFRGVGFFPNERRPRVLWCGVEATPNLPALAADIDRALAPLGIASEAREFTPHLTLARFSPERRNARVETLVRQAGELESCEFGAARETEFYLYESVLKPSGAEYKRLAGFPFVRAVAMKKGEA